ncbi:MAG: ATP-binding protein [Lachnospiraceae bacterium]|nr:ATP-binding protein [Lachnospiraceae bacterium]
MAYIKRDLEDKLIKLSKEYACILLTGPRQVGKSTILEHIDSKDNREIITLDDLSMRKLAKEDPKMFLSLHNSPILIDEVQYAPELFSYIKIEIDKGAKPGSFFLTGSQSFKLMELAKETLAGRVAIINMSALSQSEIYKKNNTSFKIDIESLKERKGKIADISEIYTRIFNGSLPALISGKYKDKNVYYSSYITTFIERDISEEIEGIDKFLFSDFIRACACRISQVLNVHALANDVGISDDTAKRWLRVLEKSQIIYLLHPYSNNLLKRTIKAPKLYFFDTGIVVHLTKQSSPEVLLNDSMNGAILENYVINEIIKTYQNECNDPLAYYYRDTNGNEIDLCIIYDNQIHPIEIKKTSNPDSKMIKSFHLLDNLNIKRGAGALICFTDKLSAFNEQNFIVPVYLI